MTHPCPTGQGYAASVRDRRCLPYGQKHFRVGAPDFGVSRGRAGRWGALPIRNGWQARRGNGSIPFCAPRGHRVHATIPRGERRALPAPAQGIHPLRIPFWGTATISPSAPVSPTPQAAGPCSWACRRLLAPPPQPDRNAARPPPTRGAGVRQHGAEGAGFRYYRMAAFSAARPET